MTSQEKPAFMARSARRLESRNSQDRGGPFFPLYSSRKRISPMYRPWEAQAPWPGPSGASSSQAASYESRRIWPWGLSSRGTSARKRSRPARSPTTPMPFIIRRMVSKRPSRKWKRSAQRASMTPRCRMTSTASGAMSMAVTERPCSWRTRLWQPAPAPASSTRPRHSSSAASSSAENSEGPRKKTRTGTTSVSPPSPWTITSADASPS